MSEDLRNKPRVVSDTKIDRLPPHSDDAEKGVLGSVFLSPNDCIDECVEAGLKKDWFYDLRHQEIWGTVSSMHEFRIPVDQVTVIQNLRDRKQLDNVGGMGYIAELPSFVPSAANLKYYLDIMREKYRLRQMLRICQDVAARVYDCEDDVNAVIDKAEQDILAATNISRISVIRRANDVVAGALERIQRIIGGDQMARGLTTGFWNLDKKIGGLCEADMVVLAARPSVGKTSLAMAIAEHMAITNKIPVGVISLEMLSEQLVMRSISSRSGINLRYLVDSYDAIRDTPLIKKAAQDIANAPIFFDDQSGINTMELRSKVRRMVSLYGIKLWVLDYLQLLHAYGKFSNRQEAVAHMSATCKDICKTLKIPGIVLAQLNRELEKKKGQRPGMESIRESGAIEADADHVWLLYKADEEEEETAGGITKVKLNVAKQRNGHTGDVDLNFIKEITRFEAPPLTEEQPALV